MDLKRPYILVVQHPVTSEVDDGYKQIMETLNALKDFEEQKLVLWPNIDAGSDKVSKGIRVFRERNRTLPYRYYKNFPPEIYNCLLANASCLVGNSSSFIREASFLGTPAVIIGDRQEGREHGDNIIQVDNVGEAIRKAVEKQIAHGKYPSQTIFGSGTAGIKIADYLAKIKLDINKRMTY